MHVTRRREWPEHVAQCLELAVLLEASADKPGNVNRTAGFQGTRYEHFLASAVAMTLPLEKAARRGLAAARGRIDVSAVGVGQTIKECVVGIKEWQRGGNTLLGTAILLAPVAVAAGMTQSDSDRIEISELRENMRLVVEATTAEDAVGLYEAIAIAGPGGLGEAGEFDVNDPESIVRLKSENVSLHEIFKKAERRDRICSEWVNNFPITFDVAYPCLVEQLKRRADLNTAVVTTFLEVLAAYPDTLIARKTSMENAEQVSVLVQEALVAGGLDVQYGREKLRELDLKLRSSGNLLNPGTTADIIAAALSVILLGGYKP